MDKHIVLAKLFEVFEGIKKYKIEKRKFEDIEFIEQPVKKISVSGCNMLCILLNNDNLNQRKISKLMNISSQAVSEIVKKLETYSYIKKVAGSQNNENIIVLTDLGRSIAEKLDKRIKEHSDVILSKLTDNEIETLYNILTKLLN